MRNPFFSIIIPVYNVEQYIEECVNSILNQSFKNIEILLVDDGSTDKSSLICESMTKYEQVRVIHKRNGGLSDARNVGIRAMTGRYAIFIDSDDYIENVLFLEKSYKIIKQASCDLLLFGYKKYYEDSAETKEYNLNVEKTYEKLTMVQVLQRDLYVLSAWGKIINTKLFKNNSLEFTVGVLSEDMDWCVRLSKITEHCVVLKDSPYMYRQRQGSITKKCSEKKLFDLEQNIKKTQNIISEIQDYQKKLALKYFVSRYYFMYFVNLALMPREIQKKHIGTARKYYYFLKFSKCKREIILRFLIRVFGYSLSLKFMRLGYTYVNKIQS